MELAEDFRFARIGVTENDGHLRFRFTGSYDFNEYLKAIQAMRDVCVERNHSLALIDLMAVEGNIPDFDRYSLGIRFAEVWGAMLKAAILAPAEKTNRFFENTAVNRQARTRTFGDEAAALEWLRSDEHPGSRTAFSGPA